MFSEEGTKLNAPFADGLVADLNATLVQQFLNISVAEREAVVEPDGVLDDGHCETVAVGLRVGHGESAYPAPIKATQPSWKVNDAVDQLFRLRQRGPGPTPETGEGARHFSCTQRHTRPP